MGIFRRTPQKSEEGGSRIQCRTMSKLKKLTTMRTGHILGNTGLENRASRWQVLVSEKPLRKFEGVNGSKPVVGESVEVGTHGAPLMVKTLDFVQYLRHIKASSVALFLDVEGSEFELMRDLITSGALCMRVDNLWMDWHPARISWGKEKLPTTETEMHKVYRWMLTSMDNSAKHQTGTASPYAHCKTVMFTVGERR